MPMRILAVCLLSILGGCLSYAPQAAPIMRANVSETLSIKMPGTAVPGAIRAMQADSSIDDSQASVRITPSIAQARTTLLQSQAYVMALADAREKAAAIAHRLGVPLGSVTSIAEFAPDGRGGYAGAMPVTKGMMMAHSMVNGPANGVVTLAVTFDAGAMPISVFGIHAGTPQPTALGDADGVWVTIAARGENFAAAGLRMRTVEAAIRSIALTYRAKITVTDADANTY
jgi:Protein of unknown function (DUF541)